ncbi:MAG: N-acetylmuramoyl-L-alanine amidase [Oscillibacter sp.]|nr:N-acetylmuramoyl-L-alanine amidase [Oscillibacter sp.]
MNITKSTSTHNTTLTTGRKPLYLVEHFTAGTHSRPGAALNTAAWFKNPQCAASADFIVDDTTAVQYNPDPWNRYTWAVGGSKYANSKGGSLYGIVTNRNSISIEICSTSRTGRVVPSNSPEWYFTDAVIDRAVELTQYLMKEYGIDAAHVIRHYDVSGKPCPGIIGWNKDTESEKAWEAFKARLSGSKVSVIPIAVSSAATTPVTVTQANTEKTIWDYLRGKGLSNYAAAGVMGNLYAESSLRANNLQDSYEKRLELTDVEYTESVDSGAYDNFVNDKAGYGLAQWTWWSRKQGLLSLAKDTGRSIGDITLQLDFLWKELQSDYPSVLTALSVASSVLDASNAFLFQFERPADQGDAVQKKRAGFGQVYYDRFSVPYLARVKVDALRIRSGPGTDYPSLGTVNKGDAFTIVEVKDGFCRLKSGVGWIAEKHTERVRSV